MLAIQPTDYSAQLSLSSPLPDFIRQNLEGCASLPTLPSVAMNVLATARSPHANVKAYADAIENDPVLTTRLLALANSAYYARSAPPVSSCQEAVACIGLDTTLAATLSFSLFRQKGANAYLQRVWSRSLIAAIASRYLADRLCRSKKGFVFTAALLQDIGVLALESLYPDEMESVYETPMVFHPELSHNEQVLFGCDHAVVGAWLAAKWGVPTTIAEAIQTSHLDFSATSAEQLCIRLSGHIADAWLSPAPAQALVTLMRKLEGHQLVEHIELGELLNNIETQLPSLANILDITAPTQRDNEALLAEAQQLLFEQTLDLRARLDQQQKELAQLLERQNDLESRSRTDSLTGIANRGWLEEQLDKRFQKCREDDGALSIIFIDIDHFKTINDQFGHAAGDRVLVSFAKLLNASVRDGDLAGRYGGEEFMAILPGENANGARKFAQRVAYRLQKQPMAWCEDRPIYVTVSIGIACLEDGGFASAPELVNAADQSMYFIKHNGRSGIAVYGR